MANREKGEEAVVIDGKNYVLVMDMQAWAAAQDALSKGLDVPDPEYILKRLNAGHMLSILAVFFGSLQKHHPEIDTKERAAALFAKSDGSAAKAIIQAIKSQAPDEADLRELGTTANPPKAQAEASVPRGVGVKHTSRRAASA